MDKYQEINDERQKFEKLKKEIPIQLNQNSTTLPTILIAGAQKGGTSALAHWLQANNSQNHGVCLAITHRQEQYRYLKEVHFFDKTEEYEKGQKFYENRFQHCLNQSKALKNNEGVLLSMDATPAYMLYPERVFDMYQNVNQLNTLKIIFSLREPISRDMSWYNHCKARIQLQYHVPEYANVARNRTYDDYVEQFVIPRLKGDSKVQAQKGLYAKYLAKWFKLFPRNQILILSYDEILENPARTRWRVEQFIGQDFPLDNEGHNWQRKNANDYAEKVKHPLCSTQRNLEEVFIPQNQQLYELIRSTKNRPPMEQHPFPEFKAGDCIDNGVDGH